MNFVFGGLSGGLGPRDRGRKRLRARGLARGLAQDLAQDLARGLARGLTRWSMGAVLAAGLAAPFPSMTSAARAAPSCAAASLSAGAVSAVKAARKADLPSTLRLAGNDRDARDVARWLWLRYHLARADAAQLLNFANSHARWPLAGSYRAAGELKLLLNADTGALAAYFDQHPPTSAAGRAAYARLLLARGDQAKARALLKKAWRSASLPGAAESYIWRNMHALLSRADDEARLWRLIMAQKTRRAQRFSLHLSKAHQKAAVVARALMRRRGGAAAWRSLPASMRGKQALRYALARYYRRSKQPLRALSILKGLPRSNARLIRPDQWWTEKRLVARQLLQRKYRKYWQTAYRLAASHGFSSGKHAYRGHFLAGFIAFEKLGQPKTALKHFERLPKLAKSRTWKSKGWYWVGRARERLGDLDGARRAYQAAAKTPTVYYGLLAREKLGLGRKPIPLKQAWPTAQSKCRVASHPLGKAVRLLAAADEKNMLRLFVWPLAYSFDKPSELAAAAALLWDRSTPANAVRLAKAAGARGIDIDNYGYPVRALPKHRTRENILELPVVLALVRQESEFDHTAHSGAGARGLMQLMPGTARLEARAMHISYHPGWLHTRPAYNLLLGRHHLARIMENFNGSYIMAFAAYNAGAGNVREWLKNYGDIRTGQLDPVEWVELIPFTETRHYVQKVLQGVHVYRTRLKRPMQPISKDLWRAAPGWRELVLRGGGGRKAAASRGKAPATASVAPAKPRHRPRDIADLLKKY